MFQKPETAAGRFNLAFMKYDHQDDKVGLPREAFSLNQ